ncbi:choice-of-anchor Q domain-containing protein [Paraglaciecola sp. 25GB23A]|uniref:choice-of-anchor Q domain-containing protein n=2 Tax=Bacteria TaxID=2 RepID=UPI0032AF333A
MSRIKLKQNEFSLIRFTLMLLLSTLGFISTGLSAQENSGDSTSRVAEVTVFGTEERNQLSNDASGDVVIKLNRRSVLEEDFNYESRFTYAVSLISAGELVIEDGHANGLYNYYNDRPDNKSMEIMAETLVIRSPWHLKGTDLTINAREVRFEGNGQIITTPAEKSIRAPATELSGYLKAIGAAGLNAGSVTVWAETYINNSSTVNFNLVGGKGQDAGRGKHGVSGTVLAYKSSAVHKASRDGGFYCEWDYAYYTPPAGYFVTRWKNNDGSIVRGVEAWPTDGSDALPAGIPGNGGKGGRLQISSVLESFKYTGGAAGAIGSAPATDRSSSITLTVGGAAGIPEKAKHIETWTSGACTVHLREDGSNDSKAGKNFPVPYSNNGDSGQFASIADHYRWLHPQLLRQILNDVKDDYLQNRIASARNVLTDYSTIIENYRLDSIAWNADGISAMTRFELSQMYDEMQLLLQQIANGQDYFGNPNGWVPMLSFEVALGAFDQEIDRSLDMVYLAKWITAKQDNAALTIKALATARAGLAAEIDTAKVDYGFALTALDDFTVESDAILVRVRNLQLELQAKDNELKLQAKENTKPSDWEVGLRIALKVAGTICEMVPVYQPALGAAGGALNLAGDFDPESPWDTIIGAAGIANSYADSGIQEAAAAQQAQNNSVDIAALDNKTERLRNLQSLSTGALALSNGIKGINATLEKSKAPQSEIEAELNKLRQSNPEYKALVDDISQLIKDKGVFASKMATTTRNIARLSSLITRNILAIDALDVTTGSQINVIDSRVNSYLKDMERRAFDRLLKYHYYMAKAYEYRLVKAYTGTLNLETMFNKILEVVAGAHGENVGETLTDGQRDLIKGVYRDLIASTTASILTDYNSSPSIPGGSRSFKLKAQQLDTLNRGEKLNLNLYEEGLFLPGEENLRIVNLEVVNNGMTTELVSGSAYGSPSYVQLTIEHSGISNLKKDGNVFQFRHYNSGTRNPITWKSQYEPIDNIISPTPPTAATDSLLMSLVPGLDASQQLLYSRPSVWADLSIHREGANGQEQFRLGHDKPPVLITDITLRVTFDRAIRVANVKELGIVARTDAGEKLSPLFSVDELDRNQRGDGLGDILRIYNTSPSAVEITAEQSFGAYTFSKWTENGQDYGSDPTNRIATVFKNDDSRLVAVYAIAPPVIISDLSALAFKGSNFEYQILVSSHGATTYTATGLPEGLSLDPISGLISGLVTFARAYNIELSATNPFGTKKATLVISLSSPVLSVEDSGPGSLREMIVQAPAGSVINFDPSLSGQTIVLSSGRLEINKNLIIDASNLANGLTIDADGVNTRSGAFWIRYGANVTINSLTITGGKGEVGGAIDNGGNLTLLNSILHDNSADFGGGAIFNVGELKVVNSTFHNNSSFGYYGVGGAIYNNAGKLTIVNSTLAGNQAFTGGAIFNELGQPWFISLENTVVAGNSADVGPDIYTSPESTVIVLGNNLIGDNSTVASWFAEGELVGTAANPVDPMLGALADNGGQTYTMLPLTGSPLINSGISQENTPSVDQRGLPRLSGLFIDIGAVELQQQGSNDNDGDGIADAIDPDDDNDGVLDNNDVYPLVAIGDYVDTDNDGAPNECDAACTFLGMAADTDDDNDGVLDVNDAYPLDATKSQENTNRVRNDLNNDGKSDLLWRSYDKGWNFLWAMNGTATSLTAPINVVADASWDMVGQGDYDGDSKSDILWRNNITGQNFIYLMDGKNIKVRATLNYVTAPIWEVKGSGDFNGDGKGDVLWRRVDRGDTWFYLMNGLKIGTSLPSLWVTDLNFEIAATGDINGDGTDDVIWRNKLTGINYIWIMQDGQIGSRYTLNAINKDWIIAGTGDLDGDGTDDIILRNQVDGRNWAYLMENGTVKVSQLINTVGDTNWQIANIGDYDGDGKADFLWRNEATSQNIVHLMDGLSIKARGVLKPVGSGWKVAK